MRKRHVRGLTRANTETIEKALGASVETKTVAVCQDIAPGAETATGTAVDASGSVHAEQKNEKTPKAKKKAKKKAAKKSMAKFI